MPSPLCEVRYSCFCFVLGILRIGKKRGLNVSLRRDYDEDEDDELNEFELMVSSSIPRQYEISPTPGNEKNEQPEQSLLGKDAEATSEVSFVSESNTFVDTVSEVKNQKSWKRTQDPLPEQDATVRVKSRKTLKQELIHNKVDIKAKIALFFDLFVSAR